MSKKIKPYKASNKEVEKILDLLTIQIEDMITEYKYTNKLESCVPEIEIYPIGDFGFIALFRVGDDIMGSVVKTQDECFFTSYGKDADLLH